MIPRIIKRRKIPVCKCGCGKSVRWSVRSKQWNKFIKWHHTKGKNNPMYGRSGKDAPMFGKTGSDAPMYGRTGKLNPMFDKKHTQEAILKMSGDNNPMKRSEVAAKVSKANKGKTSPNKGKRYPEQSRRMLNGGAAHANSFNANPSKPQVELYNLVKLLYPEAVLNYPSLNRSIDIAIPNNMLAIEYDGSYWHRDKKDDRKRQEELESVGWKFLRYRDHVPLIGRLKRDLINIK